MFTSDELNHYPESADFKRLPRLTDVAEACRDLEGTWPENVELIQVPWSHGSLDVHEVGAAHLFTEGYRMGKLLIGCDSICIEIGTPNYGAERVEWLFLRINEHINAWHTGAPLDLYRVSSEALTFIFHGIVAAHIESGSTQLPTFVPVDGYGDQSLQNSSRSISTKSSRGIALSAYADLDATTALERESLVLRQVWRKAQELGSKAGDRKIGLIQGSVHAGTVDGAFLCGARVKQATFDKSPSLSARFELMRVIRSNNGQLPDPEILRRYDLASSWANYIFDHGDKHAYAARMDGRSEEIRLAYLFACVAQLCVRGTFASLPPEIQTQVNALTNELSRSNKDKHRIRILSNKALDLATTMLSQG